MVRYASQDPLSMKFDRIQALDDGYNLDRLKRGGIILVTNPTCSGTDLDAGTYFVETLTGVLSGRQVVFQVAQSVTDGTEYTRYGDGNVWGDWTARGGGGGGGGATNLSVTGRTGTQFTLASSTGTDATIPAASTTEAGLLTATDKTKLDGIGEGAEANVATDLAVANKTSTTFDITSSTGIDVTIPQATTSEAGLLNATDKTKLNHITVTQAVDLDAIEARVNALDSALVLSGSWDASTGTFPGGGTAQAGYTYIVSVSGTVDSVTFAVGDRIIAIVDNASTATFAANWFKADYTDQVLSVAGMTGAVTLSQANIAGLTTSDSPQFAGLNIGHASDTTVTRTGAGDIAVAGNQIYRAGGIDVAIADGGSGASTAVGAHNNFHTRGTDVASASTIDLDAADGDLVDVTGTTTITGITLTAGRERTVRFVDALTLTHGSNLILPNNGNNITSAAGDTALFRGYSGGVVRCMFYQRLSGQALQSSNETAGTTNPNLIINGDFQINQRGFAGGALSAGVYGFDRWKAATGGANLSVSGYVATLASGAIEQVIEPSRIALVGSLASTAVTVSLEAPSADMTITLGSQSGTITTGSGRRSVTLNLGAGDTGNLTLRLARASGSGVTFGRVKLEVDSSATAWQGRPRTDELRLCQRYCFNSEGPDIVPSGNTATSCIVGFAFGTSSINGQRMIFPVEMRAPPTFTFFGPSTSLGLGTAGPGQWMVYRNSAWQAVAPTATFNDARGFMPNAAGSHGLTSGSGTYLAGGFLVEAEL